MSKKQKNKLTIEFKDQQMLDYITGAYNIISVHRERKQVPALSLSAWVVALLGQGAEAIYKFEHANQQQLSGNKTEKQEEK